MKLSKRQLLKATSALDWVRSQVKATEASFKMSRQLRVYEPFFSALDVDRNEIQREYTLLDDESGQPVTTVTADGKIGTRLTDTFGYEDAMEDLMKEELEIAVTPIRKAEFEKTFKKCESGHVMALVDIGFVEDPELPKAEEEDTEDDEEDADE